VLLDQVLAPRLPQDALALLGVTMADLFPDPSWNYVFGQARFTERIGVYSLLRYTPEFHEQPDSPEAQALLLRRSLKVVAHETGHMVSMAHCPFYECLMNGVNSLPELDRSPIWLCPVCLRKLQWNLKLDLRDRYRRLVTFLHRHGLGDWASWADGRLALLQGAAEDAAGSPGR
jgi:archaemetzincin